MIPYNRFTTVTKMNTRLRMLVSYFSVKSMNGFKDTEFNTNGTLGNLITAFRTFKQTSKCIQQPKNKQTGIFKIQPVTSNSNLFKSMCKFTRTFVIFGLITHFYHLSSKLMLADRSRETFESSVEN
jgi:hypothetical protein